MRGELEKARIHVYGSCVARDTIPYLEAQGFVLTGYTARQGLISALSPRGGDSFEYSKSTLTSKFQQRALAGDIDSSLLSDLSGTSLSPHWILWDLVDERNGTYDLGDGRYITNSLELQRSGLLESVSNDLELLKFGSDRHFIAWAAALEILAARHQVTWSKFMLVRCAWASSSVEGDEYPFGESKLEPRTMNAAYERYFQEAERQGVTVLNVPKELAVATRKHRWGMAPFHYHVTFYSYLAKKIRSTVIGAHDE